jgi:predicted short-subunit dehydrogenase-like oxidoreductase (DUF2520 family)
MKISIIGSGNVAWHMAQAFEDAGHHICEIYSRNIVNARLLVKNLFDTVAVNKLYFEQSEAQVFILAINDDAIEEVLEQLILPPNAFIVHTSGSKSIEILNEFNFENDDLNLNYGVFYPLMTFTKNKKLSFGEVPICIEANNEKTENILVALGQSISKTVYLVDTDERKTLHLSAVFVNNFVNHLIAISQDILEANDLEFSLLKPIIKETIAKAMATENVHEMQTGPARRGDQKIIKTHINLLKTMPKAEKIYRVLSESIFDQFNH